MKHKILFYILFTILCTSVFAIGSDNTPYSAENQLDLNRATLEQIKLLPITEKEAERIYYYREYNGYFNSVYDLRELLGNNQEKFNKIKPLVRIEKIKSDSEDPEMERLEQIYYRLEQWMSDEGTTQGAIDEQIDIARSPINVNTASFTELANLANVSPVDALAIIKHRKKHEKISSQRDLRNAQGLSSWGYRNARLFLKYSSVADTGKIVLRGEFQTRIYTTPYFQDDIDIFNETIVDSTKNWPPGLSRNGITWWDRLNMDSPLPNMSYKIRLRSNNDRIKAGFIMHRNAGEGKITFSNINLIKGYVGLEDYYLSSFKLDKLYFGNYYVSFGEGLVMDNTDFFSPQKSGFGFAARYKGLVGDVSKTEEFSLKGVAIQNSFWKFNSILFFSDDEKDAILNDDGTIQGELDSKDTANQLIVMIPRIDNETILESNKYFSSIGRPRADGKVLLPIKDVLRERTFGGNLQFNIVDGSYIGLSHYRSWYDRPFKIDINTFVSQYNQSRGRLSLADNEYFSSYPGYNAEPTQIRSVSGLNFQTVFSNVSIQGEYAEMNHNGKIYKLGDDPNAYILSAYFQYNSLNLVGLYRNYDLNFDNPYARPFSQYSKFKGGIFEDEFYLIDPIYGFLYTNSYASQAEEGFYVSMRYQLSEKVTITGIEYDNWTRKSDGTEYQRWVTKIEYRPIFPLRVKIREKIQARNKNNTIVPTSYDQLETRIQIRANLSRYDTIELLYTPSVIKWPQRPRLPIYTAQAGDTTVMNDAYIASGGEGSISNAFGGSFVHNFNQNLKVKGAILVYDGFFWNFEDSEFSTVDGKGFRYWFSVADRITKNLSFNFKYTGDHKKTIDNIDIRNYGDDYQNVSHNIYANKFEGTNVRKDTNAYRLQVDYLW